MTYSAEPQAGVGSRLLPAVLRNSRMLELTAGGVRLGYLTMQESVKALAAPNHYGTVQGVRFRSLAIRFRER